jgi:GT2 family glycosyltransferase
VTDADDDSCISLIIPVCKGAEPFRKCLESVDALVPAPAETIVVADGEGDGSWRVADARGVRVVHVQTRSGPACARNLGARAARSDILCFLDADVTVPRDLIAAVSDVFRREPHLAALFGSYDAAPGGTNFLSHFKDLTHHFVHHTSSPDASTFWAGCGAIRKDVFESLGGFDESYAEPSIEDVELGYRLKRAGHAIRLCQSLQVKHWKQWSAGTLIRTEIFCRALPWTRLIIRERAMLNDLNLRHSDRASVLAACAIPIAIAATTWSRWGLAAAAGLWLILLILNAPLYRFFRRTRGWAFMFRAIPWHDVHFLCCGLGSVLGVIGSLRATGRASKTWPAANQTSQDLP